MKKQAPISAQTAKDVSNAKLSFKLHLSSPEAQERERDKFSKKAAYGREYWQSYKKRVKRIFGTVSPEEYADIKAVALSEKRSVWAQVIAESRAYRTQTILPSIDILVSQQQLVTELRRIGNNINQLARLGHVNAKKSGGLTAPAGDEIGVEALRQFSKLEAMVLAFNPHGKASGSNDGNENKNAHEPRHDY